MNKNTQGIITVLVIGVLGYFAYKKFGKDLIKPDSRKVLIKYLDATYGKTDDHQTFINNADKSYVDAWSNALMNGQPTFTDKGVTYSTAGGKSIK